MAFWAQNSRNESAMALANAIDNSMAVMELTMDGTIVSANANCLGALGYALADIKGKNHALLVDSDTRDSAAYREFWAGLKRGEFQSGEFKRIAKGGETIWISGTYTPIMDRNGKPAKVIKLANNITAQKRRDLETREILSALHRSQTFTEWTMDGMFISANQNFLDQTGYTLSEIQGKNNSFFVEKAASESLEYREFWARLNRGEYCALEQKRFGKDGKEIWIVGSWNPIFDETGKPYKVAAFANDVTAQKMQFADFKGQIDAIRKSMSVVELSMDGTILSTNDTFLKLMGYSLSEVRGEKYSIFIPESERDGVAYREFWARLQRGETQTGEFLRMSKDHREVYIQGSYNPILDLNGKPFKVVKYAYDTTANVNARQKSESVRFIIESVADGAENLRKSVRDISEAMDKCQARTSEAVVQVDTADEQAKQLTSAADSMGGIVELIGNITGQINLLALNATIESARAGEAGRGFAVVASEVKNLANQAKQATDRIGSEIGSLNVISGDVVVALRTIKSAIENVSEYVTASTTAVKEQSEMSEVISGSIRVAASEAAGIVV